MMYIWSSDDRYIFRSAEIIYRWKMRSYMLNSAYYLLLRKMIIWLYTYKFYYVTVKQISKDNIK